MERCELLVCSRAVALRPGSSPKVDVRPMRTREYARSAARMGVPGGLLLLVVPERMDCRGSGLKFLLSAALLPLLASLFTCWFTTLLPALFSELSLSLVSLAHATGRVKARHLH